MEIKPEEPNQACISPVGDQDRLEGETIEALKANSQMVIPDPAQWMEEKGEPNLLLTTVDSMLNWARRSSLWPVICFPACCAFEFITAEASRFDMSRFGMELMREILVMP